MENDYEQGEPVGFICKNCKTTYTMKSYQKIVDKNDEPCIECEYCGKDAIVPITQSDEKIEDLQPMQKFRIVFIATERKDDYYTDDSGDYDREVHTLTGTPEVRFKDVFSKIRNQAILDVAQSVEDIYEGNASNPPYDTYSVKLIYDLCTMIPYSEDYFTRVVKQKEESEKW